MAREALTASYRAPILVLSLGQSGRGGEGFGPAVLAELEQRYPYAGGFVEFVDGGADGLELLHLFTGRQTIVVLDAISGGQAPGAVEVLEGCEVLRYANGNSAATHPGDAHELLSTAAFLGELPEHFYIVGLEPACNSGTPSKAQQQELESAIEQTQEIIDRWLVELSEPVTA
jgi:hydrogenase maturation protease